jgi:hypothetical protein
MQLPSSLGLMAAPMQKPTGARPRTQFASIAVSTAKIRKRHFG